MSATQVHERIAAEPSRRQRVLVSLFCGMTFLIIYVLSAGPMAGLHDVFEFEPFRDALEIVYVPVIVLAESDLEPVSSLLKGYIGLFR